MSSIFPRTVRINHIVLCLVPVSPISSTSVPTLRLFTPDLHPQNISIF